MSTPAEPRIHGHRNKIPYGIRFIQWIGRERAAAYVSSLTFFLNKESVSIKHVNDTVCVDAWSKSHSLSCYVSVTEARFLF